MQAFSDESEYLNLKDEQVDEDYVGVLSKQYGYDPKIPFLKMNKADIQGEYNFDFQIEDMVVRPKEIQIQQLNASLQAVGANPLFAQKFLEKYDVSKIVNKIFELNGVDIDEFKKGEGVMISAETENMMFQQGMEVPAPHEKDNHDEHIITQSRLLNELTTGLQIETNKIQQLMQNGQEQIKAMMPPQMSRPMQPGQPSQAPQNPQAMQAMQQKAQEAQQFLQQQLQQADVTLRPLQAMIRNLKLHIQLHDQAINQKNGDKMQNAGIQAPQPQNPQAAASQQVSMQRQAQQVH